MVGIISISECMFRGTDLICHGGQIMSDYYNLSSWLKLLKEDNKSIFWASARASEAVTYLNELNTNPAS